MNTQEKLSPSIYEYVRGAYKGTGKKLGEIAAQAKLFESEMNAWNCRLEVTEAREDGR